ncbi:GNAT family N-acetyltransferase [Gammaproteobacteria bacterium]|nr:GNAT family N-acetyltransferase [Gammaproteobacteria bacterium]
MPKIANSDSDILDCFHTMAELRPHLIKDSFLATVRSMEKDGYKLAYIREEANIVAVAGYRINTNLFMGKHLYIDDLVTAESQRSKGYGENLLSWLRELAISEGCSYLHLNSGTHRGRAHKFYFEQGFTIASYHFSEQLKV